MRYETSTSFTPERDQTPYITDLSKRELGCNAKQDDDSSNPRSESSLALAHPSRIQHAVQAPTCWVY